MFCFLLYFKSIKQHLRQCRCLVFDEMNVSFLEARYSREQGVVSSGEEEPKLWDRGQIGTFMWGERAKNEELVKTEI